jgi:hypothetical protein
VSGLALLAGVIKVGKAGLAGHRQYGKREMSEFTDQSAGFVQRFPGSPSTKLNVGEIYSQVFNPR